MDGANEVLSGKSTLGRGSTGMGYRCFCHARASEVMDRWRGLGAGACLRHRTGVTIAAERGVVVCHDSRGSRNRGIAVGVEAMPIT